MSNAANYPNHKNRGGDACSESGQPVHPGNFMIMYGQPVGECCVCWKVLRVGETPAPVAQ